MGNWLPSFSANPSDEDLDYYANEENMQKQKTLSSIDDLVGTGDLLGFLARQGQDVTEIRKLIGYLLKKKHNDNDIYVALRDKLCLNQPFTVPFILNDPFRDDPKIITHNRKFGDEAGDKETFYGGMERILADMAFPSSDLSEQAKDMSEENQKKFYDLAYKVFSPIGPIVKKLLEGIQKVNFFEKSCVCETNGYLDRQIGIIDIINIIWSSSQDYDPVIGFEFTEIAFRMLSKKKGDKLVFVGGPKIQVEVHAFYALGTVSLKDVIPDEDERKRVVDEIRNKTKK